LTRALNPRHLTNRVRASSALLTLAACASAPAVSEPVRLEALARTVTIHRDAWGVPHIEGPTDASVVFGLAFARAEDQFERVEQALFQTLGRNAEAGGEAGVALDRLIHAFDLPGLARAEYARLPAAERRLCDAAADGMNWYLRCHPELSPQLLRRFEPWHFLAAEYAFHLYSISQAIGAADLPKDGSNAWAIAPSRSATGNGMLLANPHIALDQVYEAHLHSDEGLHVSGMLAYGRGLLPSIGFNQHVAWSLTVNQPDTTDLFAVRFDHPRDPDLYRHGNRWRRVSERRVTLRVRTGPDSFDERELVLRSTHHGPIVHEDEGQAIAVRVAGLERGGLLGQWYAMARARNLAEFQAAIGRGRLLFHNVVAADGEGHIWYVYNGTVPRRDPSYDWTRPVDGNDPGTDWRGLHDLAELPQVLDPACGWVQSANSLPWSTSGGHGGDPNANPRAKDFPSYMVGPEQDDPRVAMGHAVLGSGLPFTFERWSAAAFDTTVHDPGGMLARLLEDLRAELSSSLGERLAPAALVLGAWDRRVSLDSVATSLSFLWLERVVGYGQRGSLLPEGTPTANLAAVLDELERRFGTWRVPWGQLNRHQRPGPDGSYSDQRPSYPCLGAHPWAGYAFCFLARRPAGCNLRYGYHGNSYVAAIELTPTGPRARTLLAYGQSSDPNSPHWDDQAALYARGETKPSPFTRAEVSAAAVRTYHPGLQELP
jgi:acyl-homoserine-lactone acylase